MLQDMLALPTMGGALLAGAAYAALSAFVTGPLVAERTIEKSGWPARCARRSLAAVAADAPPKLPAIDCGGLLGAIYGREGEAFCARYGDSLARAFDLSGVLKKRMQDAGGAITGSQAVPDSRCGCAVRAVIENRRLDFALHAGTARLVTPLSIRALDDELTRAVQAPACAGEEAVR